MGSWVMRVAGWYQLEPGDWKTGMESLKSEMWPESASSGTEHWTGLRDYNGGRAGDSWSRT